MVMNRHRTRRSALQLGGIARLSIHQQEIVIIIQLVVIFSEQMKPSKQEGVKVKLAFCIFNKV
jgi:hypothetical protein